MKSSLLFLILFQLITWCLDEDDQVIPKCGWSLYGDFIESNISGMGDTKSILETRVNVGLLRSVVGDCFSFSSVSHP